MHGLMFHVIAAMAEFERALSLGACQPASTPRAIVASASAGQHYDRVDRRRHVESLSAATIFA
jgi:hypothetical protein